MQMCRRRAKLTDLSRTQNDVPVAHPRCQEEPSISPVHLSWRVELRSAARLTSDLSLGVLTKGTIIEVNVSELGMVTTGGKVVWSSECIAVKSFASRY
jgi:hypothetical protein